jgi:hypothetical protein
MRRLANHGHHHANRDPDPSEGGTILLGSRLANAAVRALIAGHNHKMAAWMPPADVTADVGVRSPADPYCWLVDLTAVLAETDNLLQGKTALAPCRAGAFDDVQDALLLWPFHRPVGSSSVGASRGSGQALVRSE